MTWSSQQASFMQLRHWTILLSTSLLFWRSLKITYYFFSGVEIKVPRKHLISPESIQIQKELGNGEFGVVQQGVWIDKEQVKTFTEN